MILEALMGGIIVGAVASLPPGPTWILCFQRNLNKGFRSGYLLAQSDHAGAYKYHKAIADGKTCATLSTPSSLSFRSR